jgi:hypothetical protein
LPRPPFLVLALALAACAGPRWSKPGIDADTARSDFADCRSMGSEATRRDADIDADILASRGQDWSNSGTLGVHQAVMAAGPADRSDAIIALCMSSKGYSKLP